MTRGTVDWLAILDFNRALVNCHVDLIGDWYRDPWSWPELSWVVKNRPDILGARLNGRGVQRGSNLDVPKENFATRPAMVMDPVDRVVYQALVDRVSVPLIGDLRPWVCGWRLGRKTPAAGEYNDNQDEFGWYRERLSKLAGLLKFGLATDVVSFFANIPIDRLCEVIEQRTGGAVTDRLTDMLQAWARVQGRSGLPQRSMASAALANLYLRPLDDLIGSIAPKSKKGTPFAARWMDDIWVFGRDDGVLRAVQIGVESRMRDLGLNMGAAKTHVLSGDELMEAARDIQHSAAQNGLLEDPIDAAPLEELVARLLVKPEEASRTSIKFATVRIRRHKLWSMVDGFVDKVERMPHAADALGRLFRDGDAWRDLQDWYVAYAASPWGSLEWSVGQVGTMFPSADSGNGHVGRFFNEQIVALPPLQLLALASQRGASWDPAETREAIREAAKHADHPLERRVLALTAVGLKEERDFIRRLLREFEQNEVTLQMIEARRFRPLPITPDFK